jgi:hypothetical protein
MTLKQKTELMQTYYYTQTVIYTFAVKAESEEAADAIAHFTNVTDEGVEATYYGWDEDGVTND